MFPIDFSQLSLGFQTNDLGEKYLYAVNQNTFAHIASDVFFQQEYADSLKKENTFYLIIGTDSGLLINYLFANPPSKGSTYLFVEFTEVIEHALLDFQPDKDKRVYLTDYEHWPEVAAQYELATYAYINHIEMVQAVCVKDNFLSQYKQLWKQMTQELSDLKWKNIVHSGARVFIKTQIKNLNENRHSAAKLQNLLKGKTAVLLAGGPSLDLYLDWVERNREKLVVIAVSRIAKRLQKTSIIPDFFAAIDPNQVGFDVSKEVLHFSKDSILLNHYHVSPLILSQWQGPNFFIGHRYPWPTSKQGSFVSAPGPTVTNTALHIGVLMGLQRIILLGVDLCFSPEGYSHASGSIEHQAGPMTSYIGQLVTTNDGSIAETENSLFNATKTLSAQAKSALKENCQFINPSPHAAKVKHVAYIPIEQIELSDTNIETPMSLIKALLPEDNKVDKLNHYNDVISELKQVQKQLKKIIKLTKKALEYNKSLFANDTPEKNFAYKLKMDKLEKKLNKDFGTLNNLCRSYGIRAFLSFMKPANDLDMTNEEIKEWGETYYEAYRLGSKDLYDLLELSIKRTENRILELDNTPEINKLCTFWEVDHSPGRALIYKQQADNYKNLNSQEQQTVEQLIEKYYELVDSAPESTSQYQHIKQLTDLNGSEAKAYEFYSCQDLDGLQRMIRGLKQRQDEQAKMLLYLCQGYYYELQGDKEQAMNAYQQISNDKIKILALKQLALIALDDNELELAEIALYNLSCLSLLYLPKLANLYKIQKRYKDALDTYADYLDFFPEDIVTLLNMGALYLELNNFEGAEFIYQHILTLDPLNMQAQNQLNQISGIKQ